MVSYRFCFPLGYLQQSEPKPRPIWPVWVTHRRRARHPKLPHSNRRRKNEARAPPLGPPQVASHLRSQERGDALLGLEFDGRQNAYRFWVTRWKTISPHKTLCGTYICVCLSFLETVLGYPQRQEQICSSSSSFPTPPHIFTVYSASTVPNSTFAPSFALFTVDGLTAAPSAEHIHTS